MNNKQEITEGWVLYPNCDAFFALSKATLLVHDIHHGQSRVETDPRFCGFNDGKFICLGCNEEAPPLAQQVALLAGTWKYWREEEN